MVYNVFVIPSGKYEEALSVITNIEQQAPDNMCVINHKLNMIRRHGDDLCDLYKSYMKNQKIGTDSVKLLMSKFARYLAKVCTNKNTQIFKVLEITLLKIFLLCASVTVLSPCICILKEISHKIFSSIFYADNTSKVVIPSG